MPFNYGAVWALGFFALVGYLFWRGTVVPMKARRLVGSGAHLVDAGTREEFSIAHISGSRNIPAPEIARRHAEIGPPTDHVVVYARSTFRSARAARILRGMGFRSVLSLGFMERWSVADVEDDERAPRSLGKKERKS
jgi:rhodanese-related sulfurtransferase